MSIRTTASRLHDLNLVDLLLCAVSVPISMLITLRVIWGHTCRIVSRLIQLAAVFLFLSWVVDIGLEVGVLGCTFSGAREAAYEIKAAHSVNEVGNEILVELGEDLKQIQNLGFIQLVG